MKSKEVYRLLNFILDELEGVEVDWRLDGSVNLLIQGVKVHPNDLDIAVDDKGLDVFRSIFNDFIIEDKFGEKFEGRNLVLSVKDKRVEINSYGDSNLEKLNKVKFLEWRGLDLPILPLSEAKDFYQRIKRDEKVKIITDQLKINKSKDE